MNQLYKLAQRYRLLLRKRFFSLLPNGYSRANYLRKHRLLRDIGEHVYFHSQIFPSDPQLLKLGNNVVVAANVRFLGHDGVNWLLSGMFQRTYTKFFDCIEVGDNVFIGADSVILPGVKIGNNSIVGAGAVVTKDLPSGYIWGGYLQNRLVYLKS